MDSRYRALYPLPNVAQFWALLNSTGRDSFEAAIADFLAPPRERRKQTRERRTQNQDRPGVGGRRPPGRCPLPGDGARVGPPPVPCATGARNETLGALPSKEPLRTAQYRGIADS